MGELNHKTIFVMDHTQYFGSHGISDYKLEVKDKERVTHTVPLSKVNPQFITTFLGSLWTYSVEAVVEYCRIIWDIFPSGSKVIRYVISDTKARPVISWNPATQNVSAAINGLAMMGPVPTTPHSEAYSVFHGFREAIEHLSDPTHRQKELLATNGRVRNRCRVICITSAHIQKSFRSLEQKMVGELEARNHAWVLSVGLAPYLNIDELDFVILNVRPNETEKYVHDEPVHSLNPYTRCSVHSLEAKCLAQKLTQLAMEQFDLASTTVSGIPMKEDTKAAPSSTYDVELFHARQAHRCTTYTNADGVEELPISSTTAGYQTVTLKWCLRGSISSELQPCLAQNRITPADPTSRPTACLLHFLLSGRSVLLEMPRKAGGKITSHMLSAYGGDIFVHTLSIGRHSLDDLPALDEYTPEHSLTDYRSSDFAAIIKEMKLFPLKTVIDRRPDSSFGRAREKLTRLTTYFPITNTSTIVYNIKQFIGSVLTMIDKDQFSDDDFLQCQQIIYNIIAFEARQETLTLPIAPEKLKGTKKSDQYRLLWAELIHLLEIGPQTPNHKRFLAFIRDVSVGESSDGDKKRPDTDTGNSPMSPPGSFDLSPTKKMPLSVLPTKSLFEMQVATDRAVDRKRLDFAGRLCTAPGKVAKLYLNMQAAESGYVDPDAPSQSAA